MNDLRKIGIRGQVDEDYEDMEIELVAGNINQLQDPPRTTMMIRYTFSPVCEVEITIPIINGETDSRIAARAKAIRTALAD